MQESVRLGHTGRGKGRAAWLREVMEDADGVSVKRPLRKLNSIKYSTEVTERVDVIRYIFVS